jgi:hypothetical protein
MFKGIIPRKMGIRMIAARRISILCLPNIGNPNKLKLILNKATLMPES